MIAARMDQLHPICQLDSLNNIGSNPIRSDQSRLVPIKSDQIRSDRMITGRRPDDDWMIIRRCLDDPSTMGR